jgi:hypothetical protein
MAARADMADVLSRSGQGGALVGVVAACPSGGGAGPGHVVVGTLDLHMGVCRAASLVLFAAW